MKRAVLLVCAALALIGCSRDRSSAQPESEQSGLRGLVTRAFSADEKPVGGGICGDPFLQGEKIGAVPGRISGCGVEDAVRLTAVGNIKLSQPATLHCDTARALRRWLEEGARPAVGKQGGGITGLRVAAHYSCRTRNNQPGAKISEHGRGRAIDISGIQLADGSEMTVLEGWRSKQYGPALKAMHKAACGPFGTVLGPEADRFHQDHFHFDVANYRSGSYCK